MCRGFDGFDFASTKKDRSHLYAECLQEYTVKALLKEAFFFPQLATQRGHVARQFADKIARVTNSLRNMSRSQKKPCCELQRKLNTSLLFGTL